MSAVFYSMCVQVGSICANTVYREDDRPLYHRGNRNLIIVNVLVIALMGGTKAYYVLKNKRRERIWKSMSAEERVDYKVNTKLSGSRRLDFRFAH